MTRIPVDLCNYFVNARSNSQTVEGGMLLHGDASDSEYKPAVECV
jgi:hypothetical protein